MYDPMDDLFDEHPSITAAVHWAQGASAVDWKRLARSGDAVVHGMQTLNAARRHAIRAALLSAAGRAVPAAAEGDADTAEAPKVAALLQDIRDVFEAAGHLPVQVQAFLAHLSKDPDGVAALRAWGRGIGFSSAEITWLLADVAKLDHDPIGAIAAAGGLDALLAHAYTGSDPARSGFLAVDGPEVPAELQALVIALSRHGVTPSVFHLLPAVAGLTWLAGTTDGAEPENEVHAATLDAMVGAVGTCYSARGCSGKVLARNVNQRSCKRRGGKSLKTSSGCYSV